MLAHASRDAGMLPLNDDEPDKIVLTLYNPAPHLPVAALLRADLDRSALVPFLCLEGKLFEDSPVVQGIYEGIDV